MTLYFSYYHSTDFILHFLGIFHLCYSLVSDGTAFFIDFPEFFLKKPYSFWQQCQIILSDKCLQNATDLATIALRLLKNFVKPQTISFCFFLMISYTYTDVVELYMILAKSLNKQKSASSSFSWYQSSINWIKFPKKQKSTFLH